MHKRKFEKISVNEDGEEVVENSPSEFKIMTLTELSGFIRKNIVKKVPCTLKFRVKRMGFVTVKIDFETPASFIDEKGNLWERKK